MNSVRVAVLALWAHKMRSVLTMLGVILGVSSVCVLVTIGSGAQERIQQELRSIGANVVILSSGTKQNAGARLAAGTKPSVTYQDAVAIQRDVANVAAAAPVVRGTAQVVFGNLNWSTSITGTTPEYLTVREWIVLDGRGLDDSEVRRGDKIVLLGQTVANKLFEGQSPVGQQIRIDKVPFVVVGTLEPKGQSMGGVDQDDVVVMPMSAAMDRVVGRQPGNPHAVSGVVIKIQDGAAMDDTLWDIRQVVRSQHRLLEPQEDDFNLRNLAEIMKAREDSSRALTLLLGAIGSVSLLVGGIGIMNIMLVSVTERTREIGLRLAVGARRRDILVQFLVEASTLSVIGGLLGLAVGIGGSLAVQSYANLTVSIDTDLAVVAIGFSAMVGIFFGFYPARRASMLQPADALRYE